MDYMRGYSPMDDMKLLRCITISSLRYGGISLYSLIFYAKKIIQMSFCVNRETIVVINLQQISSALFENISTCRITDCSAACVWMVCV